MFGMFRKKSISDYESELAKTNAKLDSAKKIAATKGRERKYKQGLLDEIQRKKAAAKKLEAFSDDSLIGKIKRAKGSPETKKKLLAKAAKAKLIANKLGKGAAKINQGLNNNVMGQILGEEPKKKKGKGFQFP